MTTATQSQKKIDQVAQAAMALGLNQFQEELKLKILSKMVEMGAASLSDEEIDRCLSETIQPIRLPRIAKMYRDCGFMTAAELAPMTTFSQQSEDQKFPTQWAMDESRKFFTSERMGRIANYAELGDKWRMDRFVAELASILDAARKQALEFHAIGCELSETLKVVMGALTHLDSAVREVIPELKSVVDTKYVLYRLQQSAAAITLAEGGGE